MSKSRLMNLAINGMQLMNVVLPTGLSEEVPPLLFPSGGDNTR
jgi:hypothetical protein